MRVWTYRKEEEEKSEAEATGEEKGLARLHRTYGYMSRLPPEEKKRMARKTNKKKTCIVRRLYETVTQQKTHGGTYDVEYICGCDVMEIKSESSNR